MYKRKFFWVSLGEKVEKMPNSEWDRAFSFAERGGEVLGLSEAQQCQRDRVGGGMIEYKDIV